MIRPEGATNEINAIPLDDEATYKLYAAAKTVAVFQVESTGMMDALRRMKPTCIEDIVALVALYRPGPMENIPTYCEVKNGLKEIESVHPLIDHILEETQGIIVYQEQVMQIAQVMAGYSLGGADLLRRAMGKKIKEAMDAERPKFEKGCCGKWCTRQESLGSLRPSGKIRQLRLQQIPRSRLCGGQLPNRMAESEPPGRVHGRRDELRYPPDRQAVCLRQ